MEDMNDLDSLSEFEKYFTVFEGSSQEDVAYAKVFWNSLSLQPPVESSLVSVDIKQRLKIAKTPQTTNNGPKQSADSTTNNGPKQSADSKNEEILQKKAYQRQMQDEKKRYMEMAKKRDEIMVLLKKQREERIKKEMISLQHRPRRSSQTERCYVRTPSETLDEDIKEVQALT